MLKRGSNLGNSHFDATTSLLSFFRRITSTQFFCLSFVCHSMTLVLVVASLKNNQPTTTTKQLKNKKTHVNSFYYSNIFSKSYSSKSTQYNRNKESVQIAVWYSDSACFHCSDEHTCSAKDNCLINLNFIQRLMTSPNRAKMFGHAILKLAQLHGNKSYRIKVLRKETFQ